MNNIAILGATSHISKNIIFQFCEQKEYKLFLFVRSPERMQDFLKIIGHASDDNVVIKAYDEFKGRQYDVIINCVGRGDPGKLKAISSFIFRLTEKFDNLILDYLDKAPDTLYINFSSGAVYGTEFDTFVSEADFAPININNIDNSDFYRIAKINSEAKHRALKSFNIIDLRIFNFFSRFIELTSDYLIGEILSCIKQGKELKTGPVDMVRDYVCPVDLMDLIKKCLEKHFLNDVYDIYSLSPVKKFTLLDYFSKEHGLEYIIKDDVNESTATGKKNIYYSKNRKAENLGYLPKFTSLECIVKESEELLDE